MLIYQPLYQATIQRSPMLNSLTMMPKYFTAMLVSLSMAFTALPSRAETEDAPLPGDFQAAPAPKARPSARPAARPAMVTPATAAPRHARVHKSSRKSTASRHQKRRTLVKQRGSKRSVVAQSVNKRQQGSLKSRKALSRKPSAKQRARLVATRAKARTPLARKKPASVHSKARTATARKTAVAPRMSKKSRPTGKGTTPRKLARPAK